jgi:hypothetical protein
MRGIKIPSISETQTMIVKTISFGKSDVNTWDGLDPVNNWYRNRGRTDFSTFTSHPERLWKDHWFQ